MGNDNARMNRMRNGSASQLAAKPDFLTFSARRWKRILLLAIGGALVLGLFSYTRPQVFVATATVLPPEHEGMGGLLSFLSSSSAASAISMLGGDIGASPTLELFKTIIESRSVAEDVAMDSAIHSFFFRRDTSQKGIVNALNGSVQGEALRTGELSVSVRCSAPTFSSKAELDSTRRMAAYIANKFIEALDRFNRDRLMTSAKNTRIFVEQEYTGKMVELDSAYSRLEQFQKAYGAIALPEQLTATVSAAAKLTSQMQQLEMQRNVEARELSPNDPRIRELDAEHQAAQEELSKYDSGGVGEYVLALNSAPELSRQMAGYLREVKVLEQVTAYLRGELEQDRISEQRDLPSLQVLDAALPPTAPSSPNRKLFAIVGLLLGLIAGIGLIAFERFYRDVRERPLIHYRLINVLSALRYGNRAELLMPFHPQTSGSEISASPPEREVNA
ncbi:MAG: GumC family protein [Candidatus Kapaibacterium sp.]